LREKARSALPFAIGDQSREGATKRFLVMLLRSEKRFRDLGCFANLTFRHLFSENSTETARNVARLSHLNRKRRSR